ncbi:hypothetical protein B0H21DRAFT_758089 [Amylocystis lapponica]|nr:hypothetical protein B0H21DRAFT_758089 [Amylocystis lapponica]
MSTPGKSRYSAIPTPGKSSSIPTPGRFRSASSAAQYPPPSQDEEYISRAFADAIKANDPAQHRSSRASDVSVASLSPQSAVYPSQSGPYGRPSSVASSSSAVSSVASRPPLPNAKFPPRSASRQSDVFARSSSRAGASFEVGDSVRIESLGFEGTLRYLGEIDGKPGRWAGVELRGGFAGKGKNNGTVNGKQYFTCPNNCGVFVATTKLSLPTVGYASSSRPSSVTPSASRTIPTGRKTPSASNGRVTPSMNNGRIVPPTVRSRPTGAPRSVNTVTPTRGAGQNSITPGSRASKYVGMTARQLNSREAGAVSPTTSREAPVAQHGEWITSPIQPSLHFDPWVFKHPRARIPSAIAMPPPASPSMSANGRSISLNDPHLKDVGSAGSVSDLEMNGKALQDKIAELMSGKHSMLSNGTSELQGRLDRLQAQVDSLEGENRRLRAKQNLSRITELEASARTADRSLNERETTIEALERAAQQTAMDIDKIKNDADARVRDIQSKLDDKEALVANMKEVVEAKEGLQTENDTVLKAKNAEIALLEARVQKAYLELEEERRELGGQVDELRKAGQETIALYEERLSAADGQRYELEDRVASLEEQLQAHTRPPSPSTMAQYASSAAQIDNEELRDQVQHLQKKIASLEDQLEDSRMISEREEVAMRDKVKRYKEREEGIRKELNEGRKETERFAKLEEAARQRIEEIEEALRENRVALENARAEIEGLRNDVPDLDGTHVGSSERLAGRAANDHVHLTEEIVQLKHQLAEAYAHQGSSGEAQSNPSQLVDELLAVQSEKTTLQQLCEDRSNELAIERKIAADLRQLVEERGADLDAIRKKLNRELPMNGVDSGKGPSSPSRHDFAAARDEITGLKHIVQELQKENSAAAQRAKVLESENKLLLTEVEQLREDLKVLEENVEQSIMREELALLNMRYRLQTELEQLRKKQMESEMKSARTIHDLNKEIGELETLIESKDELERELERLKEKATRSQKKSSKTDLPEDPARRPGSKRSTEPAPQEEVCEICERPGHDIFTCDLLKEETTVPLSALSVSSDGSDLYCEDCEEPGHAAANCPHSQDVF